MTPGKRRYDLVPPEALRLIADVLTRGAEKHDRPEDKQPGWFRNQDWERQYTAALMRHFESWRGGEWLDASGLPHLAHVGANALILLALALRDHEKD